MCVACTWRTNVNGKVTCPGTFACRSTYPLSAHSSSNTVAWGTRSQLGPQPSSEKRSAPSFRFGGTDRFVSPEKVRAGLLVLDTGWMCTGGVGVREHFMLVVGLHPLAYGIKVELTEVTGITSWLWKQACMRSWQELSSPCMDCSAALLSGSTQLMQHMHCTSHMAHSTLMFALREECVQCHSY